MVVPRSFPPPPTADGLPKASATPEVRVGDERPTETVVTPNLDLPAHASHPQDEGWSAVASEVHGEQSGLAFSEHAADDDDDDDDEHCSHNSSSDSQLGPLRYRRGGELGRGGMGIVHAGYDPALGRDVALKRVRADSTNPKASTLDASQRRLLREARLTAGLEHPAIAGVLDVGRDLDGAVVAVMQVRRGTPFGACVAQERAATNGARPSPMLLRALLVAARAVADAHGRGILHRDLSANNILVDVDGSVSVIDWGLAVRLGDDDVMGRAGTPGAMAPEVEAGGAASPQSDVWSLGALLALAVDVPPRTPLVRRPHTCPRALWAIARRACASAPNARYLNAGAFADDLEAFLDDRRVLAHREGPGGAVLRVVRARPGTTIGVVALCLVASVVVVVAALQTRRAEGQAQEATALRLMDAAERALRADDIVTAHLLAQEALTLTGHDVDDIDSRGRMEGVGVTRQRARGVLAALGRAQVLRLGPPTTAAGCAEVAGAHLLDRRGGTSDTSAPSRAPSRVPGSDPGSGLAAALCGDGRHHSTLVSAGKTIDLPRADHQSDAGLLASGRVLQGRSSLTGSQLVALLEVRDGTFHVVNSHPAGTGAIHVRVHPQRHRATVFSKEDLILVADDVDGQGFRSLPRICGPGVGIQSALPRADGGAIVVCADAHLVTVAPDASFDAWTLAADATVTRGIFTGTLLENEHNNNKNNDDDDNDDDDDDDDPGRLVLSTVKGRVLLVDLETRRVESVLDTPWGGGTLTALGGPLVFLDGSLGAAVIDVVGGQQWPVLLDDVEPLNGVDAVDAVDAGDAVDAVKIQAWPAPDAPWPHLLLSSPRGLHSVVLTHLHIDGAGDDVDGRVPSPAGPTPWSSVGADGLATLAVDGHRHAIITGDGNGRVRRLDLRTGSTSALDIGPHRVIKDVAVSPNGATIAVGAAGIDGLLVLDGDGARQEVPWSTNVDLRMRNVAFLDDKTFLGFNWASGPRVFRAQGTSLDSVETYREGNLLAAFEPDGPQALDVFSVVDVAAIPGTVWAITSNGDLHRFRHHSDLASRVVVDEIVTTLEGARHVAINSTGTVAISTNRALTYPLTPARPAMALRHPSGSTVDVDAVALADDGRVALGFRDGTVVLLNAKGEGLWQLRHAHEERVAALRFSEGDAVLASAGWDGRTRLFDLSR